MAFSILSLDAGFGASLISLLTLKEAIACCTPGFRNVSWLVFVGHDRYELMETDRPHSSSAFQMSYSRKLQRITTALLSSIWQVSVSFMYTDCFCYLYINSCGKGNGNLFEVMLSVAEFTAELSGKSNFFKVKGLASVQKILKMLHIHKRVWIKEKHGSNKGLQIKALDFYLMTLYLIYFIAICCYSIKINSSSILWC